MPLAVTFTATVEGSNTTSVTYYWDLNGDHVWDHVGTDKASVSRSYTAPGFYTVSLLVSNAVGETHQVTLEDYIAASPAVLYVAPAGDDDNVGYATWATAAQSIGAALSLAADDVVIVVSNGVYDISEQILIDKPVTLRGYSGDPADTIVQRSGTALFRVVEIIDGGAVVENLTLRNGYARGDGGGVRMTGGTVRNCIIRDNRTHSEPNNSKGGGVYMSGGVITNCVVLSNTNVVSGSSGWGGQGAGIYATGASEIWNSRIVSNSAPSGNSHLAGGVYMDGNTVFMYNCLIAGNQSLAGTGRGGGVYSSHAGSRICNCTIVDNAATTTGGGVHANNASFEVWNAIVYDNSAGTVDTENWTGGKLFYSCTTPKPSGVGNIAADPLFVDPAAGDYRLQVKPVVSPAIDAGTPPPSPSAPYEDDLAWINSAVDLAGEPRYVNDAIDMGAYEMFLPPAGTLFLLR